MQNNPTVEEAASAGWLVLRVLNGFPDGHIAHEDKKNPFEDKKNPFEDKTNPFEQKETPLAKERDEYREGYVYIQHNWNKETNFKMNN